jgi:putative ABC transport system substrate-binding protein
VQSIQRFAKELVALQPDLILSANTPTTAGLLQQTRAVNGLQFRVQDLEEAVKAVQERLKKP